MQATGPDRGRRRLVLLLLAAWPAAAKQTAFELFTDLAAALTAGDVAAFMQPFDRKMPGYQQLLGYAGALRDQTEVLSSVQVVEDSGDDNARSVRLDWLLQLQSRETAGPVVRRHEVIRCRLERSGKHWKIVALEPVRFFAPIPHTGIRE